MTNFPVTASTLSAQGLGDLVQAKYELSENMTCELFRTGVNHTYIVNSNETKYALRVYSHNWRSREEIQEELELLRLLKSNNVSVSYPMPDQSGAYIQSIDAPEGTRYAVLFSFAEGGKVRFMDNETCHTIGAIMGKMHSVTHNRTIERVNYDGTSLLEMPFKYAKSHFSETMEEMQFIKAQSQLIEEAFAQVDPSKMATGIVHLDIWYDNMSVNSKDDITLFDFDFCGNGWLILDVAYFCKQLFHIEANKADYEEKVKHFLKGYEGERKLTDEEKQLIPKAALAAWIFYLGEQSRRFDWSNIFLSENYFKMVFVAKMKAWINYYETIEAPSAG